MYVSELNSQPAKDLYLKMLDYWLIANDPLYRKICQFAKKIKGITHPGDKTLLTAWIEKETGKPLNYFNNPNA